MARAQSRGPNREGPIARARLTPVRREEMAHAVIASQLSKARAARVYGVSAKIVSRWTGRFLAESRAGMQDRSSRPKLIPTQTAPALAERIITLRRPACRTLNWPTAISMIDPGNTRSVQTGGTDGVQA